MEFKGTKGKWIFREGYRNDVITADDRSFGIVDFGTEQEAYLADYPLQELKANALLISKAPEMLEMLKELVKQNTYRGYEESEDVIEAKKLIKVATQI
jgi:hypothetical protein